MSLRLSASRVGFLYGGRTRRRSWWTFAGCAVTAIVSWAVMMPLDLSALFWVSIVAVLGAIVSAVAIATSSPTRVRRAAPGTIEVTETDLVVTTHAGETKTPLSEVAQGWIEHPSDVRIRFEDGRALALTTEDAASAERLLSAIGVSAKHRVLSMKLPSPAATVFGGVPAAVGGIAVLTPPSLFRLGMMGLGAEGVVNGETGAILGMVMMLAMAMTAGGALFGLSHALKRREVSVGVDGITHRRRFIPYATIARVEPDARGVRIHRQDGEQILLVTGDDEEGSTQRQVLIARIMEAARVSRGSSRELDELDRRGRSIEAWRDAIQALMKPKVGYRIEPLTASDLADVVEDARAPGERRIAAALALGSTEDTSARERLRIAIDTCADETLREALERAAEAEIDEAEVESIAARHPM